MESLKDLYNYSNTCLFDSQGGDSLNPPEASEGSEDSERITFNIYSITLDLIPSKRNHWKAHAELYNSKNSSNYHIICDMKGIKESKF